MNARQIRDRLADVRAASELLGNTGELLTLAVEAVGVACPHGVAFAFTRRLDGSYGSAAARLDGSAIPLPAWRGSGKSGWIVDIDRVPEWQRNRWIEPIRAGVHGPDYFTGTHPVRRLIGPKMQPDYGRLMVCHGRRMVAWIGVYVDDRRGFRAAEQATLTGIAAQLATPLRLAAALDAATPQLALAPRQHEIVSRVALGWTNKRIAQDLGISPATVKTMLERLFRVAGADNRAALVEWWRRGE
jgi:DNA-binding CsgD family transcriptional regulator